MKIVLFLGAGFSEPFGLPTMNGFLGEVATSKSITSDDKTFIEDLVLEARRANSILESSPTNLEDILSFVVMGDRLGLLDSSGNPRGPQVKSIIRSIYSKSGSIKGYWEKYDVLLSFLGKESVFDREKLSIITTNYDLNIESALHRNRVSSKLPFEFKECPWGTPTKYGNLYSPTGIPLFKLHGSINWFEKEGEAGVILVDSRIIRLVASGQIPYPCADDYKPEGVPVLIPPSFLKPDLDIPLIKSWQGAASSLSVAEVVVFVGYSFPKSDVEMKFFLAKSLADNAKLRQIIIVDYEADAIVSRLRSHDSGFGSHFKSFLKPYQGDWTRSGLNLWRDRL